MTKAAIFTMKLESDLRAEFMAEAQASHRPASQIVRQQREQRDHSAFLQRKVDLARRAMIDGQGRPDDTVEADFVARRAGISDRA